MDSFSKLADLRECAAALHDVVFTLNKIRRKDEFLTLMMHLQAARALVNIRIMQEEGGHFSELTNPVPNDDGDFDLPF